MRDNWCYSLIYVDVIIVAENEDVIYDVENILSKPFKEKNLGSIQQYLGIELIEMSKEILIFVN